MKTTVDIADGLLARARQVAMEEGTTLRSLTEEGLRRVIEDRELRRRTQPIKPVTVSGRGLSVAFRGSDWQALREAAYEGRGG